jgi:hypothetical protein
LRADDPTVFGQSQRVVVMAASHETLGRSDQRNTMRIRDTLRANGGSPDAIKRFILGEKSDFKTTDDVLLAEHEVIWGGGLPRENFEAAYREDVQKNKQAALCLSGGGIRSAAFSLGVVQILARFRLLAQFHYLSTVSGGGYIGGWLSRWILGIGPTFKSLLRLFTAPRRCRTHDRRPACRSSALVLVPYQLVHWRSAVKTYLASFPDIRGFSALSS